MIYPEFTVVLKESNDWDIFLDNEHQYYGLDDVELARFAKDFRSSNSNVQDNQQGADPRWLQSARAIYATDNVAIYDDAEIDASPDDGAWVQAWVWVSDNDLEPKPGPTYAVWFAEQEQVDSAPGGHFPGPWTWTHDQDFTCDDDPDGRGARRSAHEYARHLRDTYPCAYVAVLPAGKRPLPICADG